VHSPWAISTAQTYSMSARDHEQSSRRAIDIPYLPARIAVKHRRPTLCAWLCGLLACGLIVVLTPADIANIGYSVPGSQTSRTVELAQRYIPSMRGTTVIAVLTNDRPKARASQQVAEDDAVMVHLKRIPSVRRVERAASGVDGGDDDVVKSVAVYLVRVGLPYAATEQRIPVIEAAIRHGADRYVSFGLLDEASVAAQYSRIIEMSLRRAELIALPATACVLVIAFLSVVAALLPVLLAAASLVCVLAIVHLLSLAFEQNVFILSTAPAIALGLSIDYSLILITRFREERARGRETDAAIARALNTSGRAIVLSGLTIVMALPALAIIGMGLFTSIAVGGIIAGLVACTAACTLLPAMVSLLGDRLERLSLRAAVAASRRGSFWHRLAAAVTTYPRLAALASVLVMLALATQAVSLRFAYGGVATLPIHSADTREVTDLTKAFGAGAIGPVDVVSDDPYAESTLYEYADVGTIWGVISGKGQWKQYEVVLKTPPESRESHETVAQLRSEFSGAGGAVGGASASEMDLAARLGARMPLVLIAAIAIVLVALSIGLKSLLVPVKAVVCSALSVSATLGLLHICFPAPNEHAVIPFFVPVVTFVLVLGLSIDYEVFLLTRMRELVTAGHATHSAVAQGLVRTGRPITLAGLAVMAVFATFGLSSLPAVSQLGVAVFLGVLLDITLVRWILSPALVVLAGRWNWWLPRRGGNPGHGLAGRG
jgi:RND superfamily putative drug exporter